MTSRYALGKTVKTSYGDTLEFLAMFDPASHCLWTPEEPEAAFAGWLPVHAATDDFPAPGGTLKRFRTLIARKSPGAADLR